MSVYLIATPLFGIGITEAVIIGGAVLILFGATRLPQLGRGIGEGIRNFKAGIKGEGERATLDSSPEEGSPESPDEKDNTAS